ncbi:hypothetical protein Daus18300_006815 [Diaporthe australafricana]|uniref:Uncharacterized protein n=1 Tax=Diaporthe australafricana TaxID=127596 RepID=A0ABR3WSF5_9PEZI
MSLTDDDTDEGLSVLELDGMGQRELQDPFVEVTRRGKSGLKEKQSVSAELGALNGLAGRTHGSTTLME